MNNSIYIGSTKDLKKRFQQHNKGLELSTKRYMPWELVYYEAFLEEKTARIRERNLKHNGNAIRQLKKRVGVGNLFKSGAGFTLIELIVVISLIGILSTSLIVLINPKFQIQRANDSRRKSDLKQIQAGLEIYRADVGGYPIDTNHYVQNSGTSLVNGATTYIQSVPKDPKTSVNYYYCTQISCGAIANCAVTSPQNPCTNYAVYSCLENANDIDKASPNPPAAVITGLACPTGSVYYKLINP